MTNRRLIYANKASLERMMNIIVAAKCASCEGELADHQFADSQKPAYCWSGGEYINTTFSFQDRSPYFQDLFHKVLNNPLTEKKYTSEWIKLLNEASKTLGGGVCADYD